MVFPVKVLTKICLTSLAATCSYYTLQHFSNLIALHLNISYEYRIHFEYASTNAKYRRDLASRSPFHGILVDHSF